MTVREYIENNTLLFDGGFGTYYAHLKKRTGRNCELANLNDADLVRRIHREYIEAGSRAIRTNTYAAALVAGGDTALESSIISEGWRLACEAAGDDAFVFADIGPLVIFTETENPADEYIRAAKRFSDCGAVNFIFETLPCIDGVLEAAEYIKSVRPDAFIAVSFAVFADGFTGDGERGSDLLRRAAECGAVDAVGFNCSCTAREMLRVISGMPKISKPLSFIPAAGYPVVVANQTIYDGNPLYFASQTAALVGAGAGIVGGCCGTTPEYISAVKAALSGENILPVSVPESISTREKPVPADDAVRLRLRDGKKLFAVELDPPDSADISSFMRGAWELKGAGIDLLTIPDSPSAHSRVDSCLLACKVRRETGLDALPHMTCRDRNRVATKSLIYGLYAEGVRNVLLVTGDPIPNARRDEDKSVFQFNSRKLASFVASLGEKELPSPMNIFGALNVNSRSFDHQLDIAREKLGRGMLGFLTQPVLTVEAFENLKRARAELKGCILGGIIPITSAKNARFMDSEINGINVDPAVIEMYEGKSRDECEELSVEISTEIARRIEPYVDGYYLMTPFSRTGMICRILKNIREF